jgi:LCP family protein required for cell wall assembly
LTVSFYTGTEWTSSLLFAVPVMHDPQEPESQNFLKPHTEHFASEPVVEPKKPRKAFLSPGLRLALFGGAILFVGAFLFSASIARTAPQGDGESLSLFASLSRLVRSGEKSISGEADDRINILLLGIGGSGHDGPELTDTIIFGSFKPSTKELGMISVPRDLTVNIPGYGYRKINAVNALAEQNKDGSGPQATADVVSEILDEPVPYTVKIDFHGFEEILDAIGGVDVYVEKDFTDTTYPLDDALGSVQTISFTKGWTHMDGKTALTFARSRHGNNGEGSDFARAARQQKILMAAKDKGLSAGVLLNPAKLTRILASISNNISTNIGPIELVKLTKYLPDIKPENVAMHVLTTGGGTLYETYVNGAYVILPYKEDWSDLKLLAQNIFKQEDTVGATVLASATSEADTEVKIEVQNGTTTTGLAGGTAELLQSSGFTVVDVTNAKDRTREKTVIYDFTNGEKDDELAALKDYLNADVYVTQKGYLNAHAFVPDNVVSEDTFKNLPTTSEKIDFLVILGQNSTNLVLR